MLLIPKVAITKYCYLIRKQPDCHFNEVAEELDGEMKKNFGIDDKQAAMFTIWNFGSISNI